MHLSITQKIFSGIQHVAFCQQTIRFEGQLPQLHSAVAPNNSSHLKKSDCHEDSTRLLTLRDKKAINFLCSWLLIELPYCYKAGFSFYFARISSMQYEKIFFTGGETRVRSD